MRRLQLSEQKNINMIDVTADSIEKTGFFCYMSKRNTEGFQRTLNWLKARFAEGRGIPCHVVEFTSSQDIRDSAPWPNGIFSTVYNGRRLNGSWPELLSTKRGHPGDLCVRK